jgi:predicted restriction endonuclease
MGIRGCHEHHLMPRRLGGDDDHLNLITLCPNHHRIAERLHFELRQRLPYEPYVELTTKQQVMAIEQSGLDDPFELIERIREWEATHWGGTNT